MSQTNLPSPWDTLRPSQQEVVAYESGRMGISAVPGSGKTYTLSMLAADIISGGKLDLNQEVLIVTLANSAVKNFSQRIDQLIKQDGLFPGMNYRVRTLHGLAHDIVRERPSLVNLANDFGIVDEADANAICEQASLAWLRAHPDFFEDYLNPELDDFKRGNLRNKDIPRLVKDMASSMIRYAKDHELTPDALRRRLDQLPMPLPLAEMGCDIYQEYQRSLAYRGSVDFSDLIRLALAALKADSRLVERLHQLWPYILEDEAQDSSRLQEDILRLLAGENGNWVRVGDPNQAIYETFTTANPQLLIDFIETPGVVRRELPVSGRSTITIQQVANQLIDWVRLAHPLPEARDALRLPHIQPTGPGDFQPNPPDSEGWVRFHDKKMNSTEEMEAIIRTLVRWQEAQNNLPEEQRETLAVLDLRNDRGAVMVDKLRGMGIKAVSLLHTSTSTRVSAGALSYLLRHLANPQSVSQMSKAFQVWRRGDGDDTQPTAQRALERLRKLKNVEDYLYPLPGLDWLEESGLSEQDPQVYDLLAAFRVAARRWHAAAMLPIDQLILTLAQDLFSESADLAVAHKLAAALRTASNNHPTWRLPELSEELETIAKNKRRFIGFSEDDQGFDPSCHKGQIVVTTMHKAKGLEWDKVYLMSVNNYDFPSGQSYDTYVAERWFLRGKLNLEAEALAQLKVALSGDEYTWYNEGQATLESRLDCIRERLRLLYVGITRARRGLTLTWNTGRRGDQQPALPFLELQNALAARQPEA